MREMQVGEDLGYLRSEHAQQWQLGSLNDRDLDAGQTRPQR